MPRRHPRQPLRYLVERQQDDAFRQWRDAPSYPPAADSPVVRAELTPIEQALTRAAQAEIDAAIAARPKPKPWELRARYPNAWANAPYVQCARLTELLTQLKDTHGHQADCAAL